MPVHYGSKDLHYQVGDDARIVYWFFSKVNGCS